MAKIAGLEQMPQDPLMTEDYVLKLCKMTKLGFFKSKSQGVFVPSPYQDLYLEDIRCGSKTCFMDAPTASCKAVCYRNRQLFEYVRACRELAKSLKVRKVKYGDSRLDALFAFEKFQLSSIQ